MEEALDAWKSRLEKVFPTKAHKGAEPVESRVYRTDKVYVCRHKVAKPTVFIPVSISRTMSPRQFSNKSEERSSFAKSTPSLFPKAIFDTPGTSPALFQSPPYSYRYFREPTVNMTASRHLREPEPM